MRRAFWAAFSLVLAACGALPGTPDDDAKAGSPKRGDDIATNPGTTSPQTPAPNGSTNAPPADAPLYDSPEVDAFFEKQVGLAGLPGMSAAVVRNGQLKWAKGYGFADLASQKHADKDTLFMLASVSKTVVAVALMTLVEDPASGLTLDTDVSTKLGFSVRNPRYPSTPITVRMLATHTSSLSDASQSGNDPGDPTTPLASWLSSYVKNPDNWNRYRPGTDWDYSNNATALAALVVEKVSGIDFAAYTKKKIFEPLAMKESAWFLKDLDVTHLATPYDGIAPKFEPVPHYGYPEYPCGELRSSAPQMARFLGMLTHKGDLDGVRILKPETITEIARIQVASVEPTQGVFFYWDTPGGTTTTKLLGHNGGDLGVHTSMFFDPTDGAGYVLLTNGSTDADFTNGGVRLSAAVLAARAALDAKLLDLAKTIP